MLAREQRAIDCCGSRVCGHPKHAWFAGKLDLVTTQELDHVLTVNLQNRGSPSRFLSAKPLYTLSDDLCMKFKCRHCSRG